jgi:DNA-directed RNA polymerase
MVSRKRTRSGVDAAPEQPPEEPSLLHRLRNCWEFANLMQYIAIFGKPMKIDEDFGIEVSYLPSLATNIALFPFVPFFPVMCTKS